MGGYITGDGGGWPILDMGGDRCSWGGNWPWWPLMGECPPHPPPILGNPGVGELENRASIAVKCLKLAIN